MTTNATTCNQLSAKLRQCRQVIDHSGRTLPQRRQDHTSLVTGHVRSSKEKNGNPYLVSLKRFLSTTCEAGLNRSRQTDRHFIIRHQPDLLQFHFLETEEHRHLHNLTRIYEILRVGTELFDLRTKLAATHFLGNLETQFARFIRRAVHTKFADNHRRWPSAELLSAALSSVIT